MQGTARNLWTLLFTLALAAGGGQLTAAEAPGSPSDDAASSAKKKNSARFKIDAIFDRIDRDNDGVISKEEFRSALAKWHKDKWSGKKGKTDADPKRGKRGKHGHHGFHGRDHGRYRHAHGRFHRHAGSGHDGHHRGAARRGWGRPGGCCCQRGHGRGDYRCGSGRPAFAHRRTGAECGPRGCPAERDRGRDHARGHRQTREHGRDHHQASERGRSPQAAFDRFDKNNDGKLVQDEVPDVLWGHLSKADANGDGQLSKEELKTAFEKRRERSARKQGHGTKGRDRPDHGGRGAGNRRERRGPGQGPGGQPWQPPKVDQVFSRFDGNKDGQLGEDEVPAVIWQHMQKADQDGDGKVSKEELKEARKRLRRNASGRDRGPDGADATSRRPADATGQQRQEADAGDATVQNESSPAATDSGSQ